MTTATHDEMSFEKKYSGGIPNEGSYFHTTKIIYLCWSFN